VAGEREVHVILFGEDSVPAGGGEPGPTGGGGDPPTGAS
jgi:hypothetical protein